METELLIVIGFLVVLLLAVACRRPPQPTVIIVTNPDEYLGRRSGNGCLLALLFAVGLIALVALTSVH